MKTGVMTIALTAILELSPTYVSAQQPDHLLPTSDPRFNDLLGKPTESTPGAGRDYTGIGLLEV